MFTLLLFACKPDPVDTNETGIFAPTYHQDIHPLLVENCTVCHSPEGMQPDILFDDAEIASVLSGSINGAVQEGKMPPFFAQESDECPNPWGFVHDPRLSDEEKGLIAEWAAAGGPVGDPDTAAPLPEPPSDELKDADLTAFPAGKHTTSVAGVVQDEFVCFSIDLGLEEQQWLEALQIIPDDLAVVHHVLTAIDHDGESAALADENGVYPCFGGFGTASTFIGGWVPGSSPVEFPEHSGYRLNAGARIILQMHYHLVDEAHQDGTGVALRFADSTPVQEVLMGLVGNAGQIDEVTGDGLQPGPDDPGEPAFFIPAGSKAHTETMRYHPWDWVPRELRIFLVANHMHYIGHDMRMWVDRGENAPDEESVCLLHTPEWDFDWQQFYFYDASSDNAPVVWPGDTLWLECEYDNTLENPGVRAALEEAGLEEPVDIYLGDGSLSEMCIAVMGQVYDVPVTVEGETHTGTVDLVVSSADPAFEQSCTGPASLRLEGDQVTGVAACGLDLGALYTVELSLEGALDEGSMEVGILGLAAAGTAVWTGTVVGDEVHATIDAKLIYEGIVVNFEGELIVSSE